MCRAVRGGLEAGALMNATLANAVSVTFVAVRAFSVWPAIKHSSPAAQGTWLVAFIISWGAIIEVSCLSFSRRKRQQRARVCTKMWWQYMDTLHRAGFAVCRARVDNTAKPDKPRVSVVTRDLMDPPYALSVYGDMHAHVQPAVINYDIYASDSALYSQAK